MKYKHKTPFISLHDRMENVKAIRYVDNVVVQSDVDEFKLFAERGTIFLWHGGYNTHKKFRRGSEINEC